jgi:hypothetical protein
MNVQGVCDADCRILYWSMLYPGSTHDSFAWSTDPVWRKFMSTDEGEVFGTLSSMGYHMVGDEAYTASHTLATPWPARTCKGEHLESRMAYNYYHSSARITIERTFGQLTRRFLILKRPYNGSLVATDGAPGIKLVFGVCVKLHNLGVERGTYRKVTYHDTDVTGLVEGGGRTGEQRVNHRGAFERVVDHPLLTSEDSNLNGEEALPAWFDDEGDGAEMSDYDPAYLQQQSKGARHSTASGPRTRKTQEFATMGVLRPTKKHW